MDGEAVVSAFAACPGPDCLKDIVPKLGQRLKVYHCIRSSLSREVQDKVSILLGHQ